MHSTLTPSEAHWYQSMFNAAFNSSFEGDFERLFISLMSAKHGEEFGIVQNHGSEGDHGCDGYLRRERTIFQCYGPITLNESKMSTKMSKDIQRAKEKWEWMAKWCFVINRDGPPPRAAKQTEKLMEKHDVDVRIWCYRDLEAVLSELTSDRLRQVVESYPNMAGMDTLSQAAMDDLIDALEVEATGNAAYITPRPEKMRHNGVGNGWRERLKSGMPAHGIVQSSFDSCKNPSAGEAIVASIHGKYKEFYDAKPDADWALESLYKWLLDSAGSSSGSSRAVFALLTYCFEICKVLEPVPEVVT